MRLYTIGHSTHSVEHFVELLHCHSITAVCDVRSQPYSGYTPQFNRELLERHLRNANIRYVFLGDQLGARSRNPNHYAQGRVQYSAIATSTAFIDGLGRLRDEIARGTVAIMCSEKDPINCHRAILVCRYLRGAEIEIFHILGNGTLESGIKFEERLRLSWNIPAQDLFDDYESLVNRAYDLQAKKIAYSGNLEICSEEEVDI